MQTANSQVSLSQYKKQRNEILFLLLGYIPFSLLVDLLSVRFSNTAKPAIYFAVLWGLVFVVRTLRFIALPCPVCGRTILSHPLRGCATANPEK